jgi:hypothetical protein
LSPHFITNQKQGGRERIAEDVKKLWQ